MLRREFLSAVPFAAAPIVRAPSPNILYILADDMGWGDMGCYNPESKIPTPNLDRLAGQGVRFTDMHSPSSVCTPTRYGVMTGRYCWRSELKRGVLQGYSPNLIEAGRPTVASLLKGRGYATGAFGKWHLGLGTQAKADYTKPLHPCPNEHGFDTFYGIPASLDMPPYLWIENDRAVAAPTSETPGDNGMGDIRGRFFRGGAMAPGFEVEDVLPAIAGRAERFLKAQSGAKPFFLYLPLTAPHTPWAPTAAFKGRTKVSTYGDFVTQVDESVGRILRTLEDAKLGQNTLVCFTSDNGSRWLQVDIEETGHRANAGWRGMKADIYEAGHRVPFIARWPGRIKGGTQSAQLGCLTDLAATAAELSGQTLPRDAAEDSFSLVPAMLGSKAVTAVREAVVHHSSQGMFAIRQGPWKLALGRGSGGFTKPVTIEVKAGEPEGELYHLGDDPGETRNRWAEKPAVVASLTELLEQYRRDGRSRPAVTK
jgi:arylsulfatase A-like enzyme